MKIRILPPLMPAAVGWRVHVGDPTGAGWYEHAVIAWSVVIEDGETTVQPIWHDGDVSHIGTPAGAVVTEPGGLSPQLAGAAAAARAELSDNEQEITE
jgi:hypothetical protein